jgi:hypothetical protein
VLNYSKVFVVKIPLVQAAQLFCLSRHSLQVSIMRDSKHWSETSCGSDHSVLFVDDSIAEHLDDGFEGFNCVRVLFTRGVKGGNADDDS